jgi:predicted glycogen debranching enzyme
MSRLQITKNAVTFNSLKFNRTKALKQTPSSSLEILRYCGDSLRFELETGFSGSGAAFLRTNIGSAAVKREEIIAHTEKDEPVLARDWHDLPMHQVRPGHYRLCLPLLEVGCFAAKAWFLPTGSEKPLWVNGENTKIKVEPSFGVCANTMYTAFVRQFGPQLEHHHEPLLNPTKLNELERAGYTVIPPSGTFRALVRHLDFIVGSLRSRIIQLLPIHPEPTTYGKMGSFGSPFAAMDFFDVNPAYAEFDVKATPMEQFIELIDAVHAHGARLFIDIPVNHTGWASRAQTEHPEWFVRHEDGTFVSPGAWGVTWEDLCKLNYKNHEVHALMADVFLFWCRHGVDGFRCDAGYMLPYEAWEYIVAKVRREYPETIFLLEGLGGLVSVTERLLVDAGLNWAYSELFQNYDRSQIESYLPPVIRNAYSKGLQVHFAETHDNSRLAARNPRYAAMRTALCALFSQNGGFGITNGLEWFAIDKVDVHGSEPLNWNAENNQVEQIRRLQTLLTIHPVFFADAVLELIQTGSGNNLALRRHSTEHRRELLVLVNLDEHSANTVTWQQRRIEIPQDGFIDLLTGGKVFCETNGGDISCQLPPGQVYCLTARAHDLEELKTALDAKALPVTRVIEQRLRHLVLKLLSIAPNATVKTDDHDEIKRLITLMIKSPLNACMDIFAADLPPVVNWHDDVDRYRQVMIPPQQHLIVWSKHPFRAEIRVGAVTKSALDSLPLKDGRHFAIASFTETPQQHLSMELRFISYAPDKIRRYDAPLLLLANPDSAAFKTTFCGAETRHKLLYSLCTNNLGGMSQTCGAWGVLNSKYDAVLAGNCNPVFPVDRQVMFTRCRGWLVYRDYSHEINPACTKQFSTGFDNQSQWHFSIPVGQGKTIELQITLKMAAENNSVQFIFHRLPAADDGITALDDKEQITIILRPDIEDRSCHELTKAITGAENAFRAAVVSRHDGFDFNPSGKRNLALTTSKGEFVQEQEWRYMEFLPLESERGMECHTDLFSPGYFSARLAGNDKFVLGAAINGPVNLNLEKIAPIPEIIAPQTVLRNAIRHFIVKRDEFKTVIAGYPWFLDWGRDTFICLRGMIAAGFMDEVKDIICQFAKFERFGTLPNMIRGNDDSNRDTSDAPLWFIVATADYVSRAGKDILSAKCGSRTLLQALESIVKHYSSGTPNGIIMDKNSGLIFSPSHYTWMDTNFPAGSPREGYPIEIQALWFAALRFMGKITANHEWIELAKQVKTSTHKLFYLNHLKRLSDCLHAKPGVPAQNAIPDDACRCNQLFAVTLGLITDTKSMIEILTDCEQLLIPGGIRSLAALPVTYPLPVYFNNTLLNDPVHPYWGHYRGDEDTRRKPAYHNGTAWSWPFPAYCEALFLAGGEPCRERAAAILMSATEQLSCGVPGHTPEIMDGDYPHQWRGCGAQAWGATELFRVCQILLKTTN